jgi:hypothetical protein
MKFLPFPLSRRPASAPAAVSVLENAFISAACDTTSNKGLTLFRLFAGLSQTKVHAADVHKSPCGGAGHANDPADRALQAFPTREGRV